MMNKLLIASTIACAACVLTGCSKDTATSTAKCLKGCVVQPLATSDSTPRQLEK